MCMYILEKLRKQRGLSLQIPPDLPSPQLTHSIHQTTVLIRFGLAFGVCSGWVGRAGGAQRRSGPWGEVGGRGRVWGVG